MHYYSQMFGLEAETALISANTVPSLPYKVKKLEFSKNEQKEPWFLEINPNGRIPAITDTFTDGKTINIFESGSILQYLADNYDPENKISYPRGTREFYEQTNWLFYQNAGLGPMQGKNQ
jgi:glutathione S-transferase